MPFDVKFQKGNRYRHSRIFVYGAIDNKTFEAFQKRVIELSQTEDLHLVILNFFDLKYINSRGMSALVQLRDLITEQKKKLILEEVPDKMYSIFQLLGLGEIFEIYQKKYFDTAQTAIFELEIVEIGSLNNKIITEVFLRDVNQAYLQQIKNLLKKIAKKTKFILVISSQKTKQLLKLLVRLQSLKLKEKGGKIILLEKTDEGKRQLRKMLGDRYFSCFYVVSNREKALELIIVKEASKKIR